MYEKLGYLAEDYKIFALKDYCDKNFSMHYHEFYKIILFESGKVNYIVEGKNYELVSHDIVLVSANQLHKPVVDKGTEYERIVLYLSQSFLHEYSELADCFSACMANHSNIVHLLPNEYISFKELIMQANDFLNKPVYAGKLRSRMKMIEAMITINEAIKQNGFGYHGSVSFDQRIIDICAYIDLHICDELTIDILSEKSFVSKYHFMRIFKENTGMTIHSYILKRRLQKVTELIRKGEKVTVACIESGFKDYSTYLRAKKRMERLEIAEKD